MATITAMCIDFMCDDGWLSDEVRSAAKRIFDALGIDDDVNEDLFDEFRYDQLEGEVLSVIQDALDAIDWDKELDPDKYKGDLLPYAIDEDEEN